MPPLSEKYPRRGGRRADGIRAVSEIRQAFCRRMPRESVVHYGVAELLLRRAEKILEKEAGGYPGVGSGRRRGRRGARSHGRAFKAARKVQGRALPVLHRGLFREGDVPLASSQRKHPAKSSGRGAQAAQNRSGRSV